jgi:glycosyltransferase involved in cell wall biosynthesis
MLVQKLGLEGDVAMPGFVDNPYKYMAKSAGFVLSSRWEGLPTVLIEALATGIPVISTDCHSGPSEILQNGRLGRLVPVGEVTELAEALATIKAGNRVPPHEKTLECYEMDWATDAYLKILQG